MSGLDHRAPELPVQFESRKRDHIVQALQPRNQSTEAAGLDSLQLVHEALPELDFSEISLETPLFGQVSGRLRIEKTPFYVAGMTAGHPDAPQLNRTLALACAERGWAMGVGSQRRELEDPASAKIDQWKSIRAEAPGLSLIANLGLSQLIRTPLDQVRRLTDSIEAQAIAIHLNVLQEALQMEGTPEFRGGLEAIQKLCRATSVPVVLKETGCGFSASTLERLAQVLAGTELLAIDVSGVGGTHWGRIEGARSQDRLTAASGASVSEQWQRAAELSARAAETFANWGMTTWQSVAAAGRVRSAAQARRGKESRIWEVWASGGMRSGLDAAKMIALGAHRVGFAKPALEAALTSPQALRDWMEQQEFELKVALFCTGSKNPAVLRETGPIVGSPLVLNGPPAAGR